MFSYYGSKSKIVKRYPSPTYDTIIEPFAGSARYSLHGDNWKKNVRLYDTYEVVVELWKYLIRVDEKEILALPDAPKGTDIRALGLTEEQRYLMGFCINRGSVTPKNIASGFNSWSKDKLRIAGTLHKIRHWKVEKKDYREIENPIATWFIDPPYRKMGVFYPESSSAIDFDVLSHWCRTRNGQIIVCENIDATWMPFIPLTDFSGAYRKNIEAIWTNESQVSPLATQTVIDPNSEPPLA